MGKLLIIIGVVLTVMGLLMIFKIPIPLGKLPGDIIIKTEHVQFYFPIVTCILFSLLLSLIFYFFS